MIEILRADYPQMAEADEGRFVPFVFGYVQRAVPIGIQVGPSDPISAKVTSSSDTIQLTSIVTFDRFPTTGGKLQIGSERLRYTGIVRAQLLLTGVTHGEDSTGIADHAIGDQCYLVLDKFKYIVCENPRKVHFTQAITAVYLNGALKKATDPPTHTINMDDRDTVAARSVVTITFDLTTLTGANVTAPPAPSQPVTTQAGGSGVYVPPATSVYNPLLFASSAGLAGGSGFTWSWLKRTWFRFRYGRRIKRERARAEQNFIELREQQTGSRLPMRRGYSLRGGLDSAGIPVSTYTPGSGGGGYSSGGGGSGNLAGFSQYQFPTASTYTPTTYSSSSPQPPVPGVHLSISPPTAPVTVKQFAAPVIGTVEVDITGLQDDSIGTITGTPNLLIDRPAWVVRTILREVWGELDDTNYDLTSFSNTHALQVVDGLHWAVYWDGTEQFSSFRDQVMIEGRAHLFQWAGLWRYIYRKNVAPSVTITQREIIGKGQPIFAMSQRTNLTTELVLTWAHERNNTTVRRQVLRSKRGIRRSGIQRNRQLALRWVWEDNPALALGNYWLSQWDTQRVQVNIPSTWVLANLIGWDTFAVDVPLTKAWGVMTFHITDLSYNADSGALMATGTQTDQAGIVLDGTFFVTAPKNITLDGTFFVLGGSAGEAQAIGQKILTPGLQPPGERMLRY